MGDYFNEYTTFAGAKSLPSPADTPYETPNYIRSKRSSRATASSSREVSSSPPPLPPDAAEVEERAQNGRYTGMDPRRFTPTLHASLVSEILNLRRELDSKNHLVENLESGLADASNENRSLTEKLSQHVKDVKKAKLQVQQMEKGTYDAVENLAQERDIARSNAEELKARLEAAQRLAKRQDEDAERTQRIWDSQKVTWDNERRQLERSIHVTESRLRTFVDEMNSQQAAMEAQQAQVMSSDEFKDSGLGNESDTTSIGSVTPRKHRRTLSSLSSRSRKVGRSVVSRTSVPSEPSPQRNGNSLADELDIDEEDEYDLDEFDHPDDELDVEYSERLRRTMESRQSSVAGELADKAKRVLGLTTESADSPLVTSAKRDFSKKSLDSVSQTELYKPSIELVQPLTTVPEFGSAPRIAYVDRGYQPSPPPSPQLEAVSDIADKEGPSVHESNLSDIERGLTDVKGPEYPNDVPTRPTSSPISPPDTPKIDSTGWTDDQAAPKNPALYISSSTQTEAPEAGSQPKPTLLEPPSQRNSLSPPDYVPAIAIHPPTSRPSTPKPYVLPPGTKNASVQVNLLWPSSHASVQTETISMDQRLARVPPHLLPGYLLPKPNVQDPERSLPSKPVQPSAISKLFNKAIGASSASSNSQLAHSQLAPSQHNLRQTVREGSAQDVQNMPLKALPVPRPILAPSLTRSESAGSGPLNRSTQYGVTTSGPGKSPLLDIDGDSEPSDNEEPSAHFEHRDLASLSAAVSRPPQGRFGLSEPPKAVPEHKEASPERRPGTADSNSAAPAPSIASSRNNSVRAQSRTSARLTSKADPRSRSPSFDSMASSFYSAHSAAPPFPVPTRHSSRVKVQSDGSHSPTPNRDDPFGVRNQRPARSQLSRQGSLRKVQSAAIIRDPSRRSSPPKSRRRRRSPNLTPIYSMALDSPEPTQFPIPELPTELRDGAQTDYVKGFVDLSQNRSAAADQSAPATEEGQLVDAIAGTMVGEWMWKYIRKRKSFRVEEDFPVAEDGSVNTSTHGSRHKRWVWLSPYERTIMWDSKQPTTGTALLGKKGRKLAIQSVLEVTDSTPLPRGAELNSAYNRSILILTPARALKFTTVSAERHVLWMTALSFLAQSGRLPAEIPTRPLDFPKQHPTIPIPAYDPPPIKQNRSSSFGRANVRDSIRVAKGKRHDPPTLPSHPETDPSQALAALEGPKRDEGADFPAVPRLYVGTNRHQRKRSNTSPRLPSLAGFRSFSSNAIPSTASSTTLQPGPRAGSSSRLNMTTPSSRSGSRQGTATSPTPPNFFEAVGMLPTVRMEAFVDPSVKNGVRYVPAPLPPPQLPPAASFSAAVTPRRRREGSNVSQATFEKRRAGYVFDEFGKDPFKGF